MLLLCTWQGRNRKLPPTVRKGKLLLEAAHLLAPLLQSGNLRLLLRLERRELLLSLRSGGAAGKKQSTSASQRSVPTYR